MIAYIEGKLTHKSPAYVILETGGIGYQIHISLHTWTKIQSLERCRLLTHQQIKEDAHTLFGFFEEDEKQLFIQLISVSGVGPSIGRMVLSSLSPDEVKEAILTENEAVIKAVKGIGPKSAKRLILELKDKVGNINTTTAVNMSTGHNTLRNEALTALVMLGFARAAGDKAISKVLKSQPDIKTVEDLIKLALQNL
ncbi:MAG: Holliday junction DNA helicase RuvA [Limisphaerales bacterium]|jgi:Holliday junction DNA helicase RuvA